MIFKMKKLKKFNIQINGFSLVELIVAVGMISTLSGLILPSFLNWVRAEKVNAYTRELREFFRVVRLDSRRWSSSCLINLVPIKHNAVPKDRNYYGYSVNCDNDSPTINSLAPAINNSIFQVTNKNFLVTPNGRISSDQPIVVVIGSQYYNSGSKTLNCLIIQAPTGHIIKGKFYATEWITNEMEVSKIDQDNIINPESCLPS